VQLDSTRPVVPWDDQELLQTARANFGLGADSGLPDDLRFLVNVVRVIRTRLRQVGDTQTMIPAIFFLLPAGPTLSTPRALKSEPMLDNGVTPVEGHFWFVNPLARTGRGLPMPDWTDDAAVFKTATDELAVGCIPAVVLETRTTPPSARFYPGGLAEPDVCQPLLLSAQSITVDDAIAVIDRVHRQSLVTPNVQLGATGKLWAKQTHHWPKADAETRIQVQLRTGLIGAFPSCIVRAEQGQATGRLDLEIEESTPGDTSMFVRHLLLELKVLRSFGSTGIRVTDKEITVWIKEGVEQAAAYGNERGVRAQALFCFDMRISHTRQQCFKTVKATAKKRKVHLRAWHIFASAKEFRTTL
jgi:hypothetical protein